MKLRRWRNMIKLLGCVMILFACLGIASGGCKRLKERVQTLERLEDLLAVFSGEVRYGMRPLPQLFERLGRMEGGAGFAAASREMELRDGRGAGECFCAGMKEGYPDLPGEDLCVLLTLGEGLGVCDGETQCRQIDAVRERLGVQCEKARETAMKNTRLYQGLGLLGGLFFILLLL